ncbi:hypothetical protein KEM56_001809 [Ascosphaera pollenicola]|nr:hypothetical protein KEM56_001809 [Ascosphaera pollenicola]
MASRIKESFKKRFSSTYKNQAKEADSKSVDTETTAVNEEDKKKEVPYGESEVAKMRMMYGGAFGGGPGVGGMM